jgi:hypothetical protein
MRLAVLVVVLAGCAPGVKVVRYVAPAKLDPGSPGRMVVEVTGTASAISMLQPSLERIAKNDLGFELVTERGEGVAVLHAEVERYWHQQAVVQTTSARGPPTQTVEQMQLVVTLTRADGTTASASYQASQTDLPREHGPGASGNGQLAAANARLLLQQFSDDFVPASQSQSVDFDDDASVAEGLQLAKDGDLVAAEAAWRKVDSAQGHYNVGALLEARGAREEALAEYEAAAKLSTDPKYAGAADAVKKSVSLVRRK